MPLQPCGFPVTSSNLSDVFLKLPGTKLSRTGPFINGSLPFVGPRALADLHVPRVPGGLGAWAPGRGEAQEGGVTVRGAAGSERAQAPQAPSQTAARVRLR